MDDLVQNSDPKKLAELLQAQESKNNLGLNMYLAGGQMQDIPVPNGVPKGFFNPPQQFQQGVNMTPLLIGGSVPVGEGRLMGNVMGSNVNTPDFSRTSVNQVGLGYSHPVAGGTLSANVNIPTQGNNYNAMLRYNKQF